MKRVIGMLLIALLLVFNYNSAININIEKKEQSKANTDIIDTVTYLDYSLLYTYKSEIRNDTCLQISYYDADLIMKVARAEGGDTLDGQLWTMRTILNRIDAGWANNIWDIVSMTGQFEVFTNGSYINADVNSNTHVALAMIEGGWDETQGALYWESNSNGPDSWHKRNLQKVAEIEGNIYYK